MSRVFVGNLPMDVRERELDDLFYKYGRIRDIDIKNGNRPPAFAFITFDDVRDAEDAVRGRDGYNFDGNRLRCEFSRGRGGDSRGGGGGESRGGGYDAPRNRPSGRHTDFRVLVSGLPRSASWQDLKDHMRRAGDVTFTDVDGSGGGVVEYSNPEDMDTAVRKLDDTEFKNRYETAYVRVRYDKKGGSKDKSRSRSRSRSRGRRSPSRSKSPSRSRSRDRSASRSVSRERVKEEPSGDGDEPEPERAVDDKDDDDAEREDA